MTIKIPIKVQSISFYPPFILFVINIPHKKYLTPFPFKVELMEKIK